MKGLWKEHNTARKLEYIYYQGAIPCNLLFPRNNIPVQNSQETHLESGIFYQALRPRDQLFISAGIKINLVKHIWSIRVRCFIQSFALVNVGVILLKNHWPLIRRGSLSAFTLVNSHSWQWFPLLYILQNINEIQSILKFSTWEWWRLCCGEIKKNKSNKKTDWKRRKW